MFAIGGIALKPATYSVVNAGNFESRPILVFNGPLDAPAATNLTLGATLAFTNPANAGTSRIDLLSGETLTVDLDKRTVVYSQANGVTVPAKNWLVPGSTWWNLPPGGSNLRLTSQYAAVHSPMGSLTVQWASAWDAA